MKYLFPLCVVLSVGVAVVARSEDFSKRPDAFKESIQGIGIYQQAQNQCRDFARIRSSAEKDAKSRQALQDTLVWLSGQFSGLDQVFGSREAHSGVAVHDLEQGILAGCGRIPMASLVDMTPNHCSWKISHLPRYCHRVNSRPRDETVSNDTVSEVPPGVTRTSDIGRRLCNDWLQLKSGSAESREEYRSGVLWLSGMTAVNLKYGGNNAPMQQLEDAAVRECRASPHDTLESVGFKMKYEFRVRVEFLPAFKPK